MITVWTTQEDTIYLHQLFIKSDYVFSCIFYIASGL